MKIRQGFVSNSSTSSFIVFGIKLSEEEIQKFIIENVKKVNFEKENKKSDDNDEPYSYDKFDSICMKKIGLEIINKIDWENPTPEAYGIYIGKDMGNLEELSNKISLENLLEIRTKLSIYFPNKKAGFYGRIIENG